MSLLNLTLELAISEYNESMIIINVRENRRGNPEWTIQRNVNIGCTRHKTNKTKNTKQKTKKMSITDPTKNRGELRRPKRTSSTGLLKDTCHVTRHIVDVLDTTIRKLKQIT
jgi:hypothetical protein